MIDANRTFWRRWLMLLVAFFSIAHAQILYACDTMQLDVPENCCCADAEMISDRNVNCDTDMMADEPSSCCHVEVRAEISADEETKAQLNNQDLLDSPALLALVFTLLDFSLTSSAPAYPEALLQASGRTLYLETSRLRI